MKNNGAGKGDSYRKVDQKKWDENYSRIFGKAQKTGKKNENNRKDR
jgi:hypothetical protein